MTKKRTPIPSEISAQILFESDRTCCVCNHRGRNIQIHHIDENPSNNNPENLAVLCLECHNDTMIKGGFGRKLNADQVVIFKKEWLQRVVVRKQKADELASIQSVTGSTETIIYASQSETQSNQLEINDNILLDYLEKILLIKNEREELSASKIDSGITSEMNSGAYDMVSFYEEVLNELSKFYPPKHFHAESAQVFFSNEISSRFRFYGLILESDGIGTGGTIVSSMKIGKVIDDLKNIIKDIVVTLILDRGFEDQFNYLIWDKEWNS